MRKKWSLSKPINRHIVEYSSIYWFIAVLFIMGVIFGAVIVNSLSASQKGDLFSFLNQFFGQISAGKMASSPDLFRLSFLHNAKFLGFMWILGISIIGLPIILILLFLKGVVVGFSVGFLVNQMGWGGFLLSFVSVLPQNLLIIPMFIFVAAVSVGFSLKLIRKVFIKQHAHFHIFSAFTGYAASLLIAIGIISVAAGVEAYLSPELMKSVMAHVK